jgi:hypothetical protein
MAKKKAKQDKTPKKDKKAQAAMVAPTAEAPVVQPATPRGEKR